MVLLKAPAVVEAVGLHLSVGLLLEPPHVEVTSVVTVRAVLTGSYVIVTALLVVVPNPAKALFKWWRGGGGVGCRVL